MEEMMHVNLKEMREEIKPDQAEIRFVVNAWIADMKDRRRETMSCQVTTEACLYSKELNPEDIESQVEHREVPTEEIAVKSSGTMKKRHRGQHLVARRHGEPKELTRRNWIPEEVGCRLQEGVPPRKSSLVRDK
jgi:hypothetical protein